MYDDVDELVEFRPRTLGNDWAAMKQPCAKKNGCRGVDVAGIRFGGGFRLREVKVRMLGG